MTNPIACTPWVALTALTLTGLAAAPAAVSAQTPSRPAPVTRLFVQDMKASMLKWANVRLSGAQEWSIDPFVPVPGFKTLDPNRQKLVQMNAIGSHLCVGVRDDDEGRFESGWILLRAGVTYHDHGDHGHWNFRKDPAVIDQRLDTKQGNPAHLYVSEQRFFLANDKLNGYTRIDPDQDTKGERLKPRFISGGGNHITLAVVNDTVGYSAWIDGGGPNRGRVDVSPIAGTAKNEPAYSFHLPTGAIHGAIANSGKVFFAPADGICWVEADPTLSRKAEQVAVRHISLGKEGDKPRRTGAFVNHAQYVLFTTGKESGGSLVLLNAKHAEPKPVYVKLNGAPGTTATTPKAVLAADGTPYAFICHDRVGDSEAAETMDVVLLDPNRDGDCSDAKVLKSIPLGKSAVDGHYGHHDLAFDADRRYAFVTNPGDGTITILSLKALAPAATVPVGFPPGSIIAIGSLETKD